MQERVIEQDDELVLFFSNALKKMYWAEQQIAGLLDEMHVAVFSNTLKNVIEMHQSQTRRHVARLEQVFAALGVTAEEKFCEALKGLLNDAQISFAETMRKTRTRDMGIIASLLKVEHYELATYIILTHVSQAAGLSGITNLLQVSLAEKKEMEAQLNRLRY